MSIFLVSPREDSAGATVTDEGEDFVFADKTRQIEAVRTQEMEETRKTPVAKASPKAEPTAAPKRREPTPPAPETTQHYTEYQKTKLTSRGAKFFWTFFVLTLPILALIAAAFFGIFALCVVSVCALIAALFIILAAIVMAGSIIAIVSLIYGVIMIRSGQVGIGIYEIGVGIVSSGVALILSVGVYLAATRAMPYLLRLLVAFTGHTLSQIPGLWDRAREECNKL